MNYTQRNNNIIINNNKNHIESINSINNIGQPIDKIYFKKNIFNNEIKIGDIYKYK